MRPISPDVPGHTEVVFAKDQPPYQPLPAVVTPHELTAGYQVLSRWTLSDVERLRIARGEDIYLSQINFGTPLTPVLIGLRDTFIEDQSHGTEEEQVGPQDSSGRSGDEAQPAQDSGQDAAEEGGQGSEQAAGGHLAEQGPV